VTTYYDQFWK